MTAPNVIPRAVAFLAVVASVAAPGCKRAPDPEAEVRARFVERQALATDAGAVWRLTSTEEIFFDDGWWPTETSPKDNIHGEAWRWMSKESLLRLRTHAAPMKLTIKGWVPLDLIGSVPLLTLRWKGKRIEAFLAPAGRFTKEVDVTEAMQAGSSYADFTIETTSTAHGADDARELGFAAAEVRWEPANQ